MKSRKLTFIFVKVLISYMWSRQISISCDARRLWLSELWETGILAGNQASSVATTDERLLLEKHLIISIATRTQPEQWEHSGEASNTPAQKHLRERHVQDVYRRLKSSC